MTSITGQCPTCGTERNANVVAEHEEIFEPSEEPFDPTVRGAAYRILKCKLCNTVYFQLDNFGIRIDYDEELGELDITNFAGLKCSLARVRQCEPDKCLFEETIYWPDPPDPSIRRERPDWSKLPDVILIRLLNSVYTALDHDLTVLAAMGMRVVFDRASELIGVDASKSFARKLDQLHRDGHISAVQKKGLEVLVTAGSAAAHGGWEPNPQQLDILVFIMEDFVRAFILEEAAGSLKEVNPPRQQERTANARKRLAQLIEFPSARSLDTPIGRDRWPS